MIPLNSKKQGFALLMALIVVSVVISIGLSVLELTLKQVRLSTNSKDSEIVFHATNAGLECARYWLNKRYSDIESGIPIAPLPTCFGQDTYGPVVITSYSPADGSAYKYDMAYTWGASNDRCSKMTILTLVSTPSATTTVNNMTNIIPAYPGGAANKKDCGPSGRCSVISIQGFNRACSMLDSPGTLQREVLLQL